MHEHYDADTNNINKTDSEVTSPTLHLITSSHTNSSRYKAVANSNHFTNPTFRNDSDESLASTTRSNKLSRAELKRKQDLLKFQQTFKESRQHGRLQQQWCTCKKNQKQFDCFECTQFFPVQVRRSRDGESGNLYNRHHIVFTGMFSFVALIFFLEFFFGANIYFLGTYIF